MSYIGNTPTQQNFVAGADQFSGNGSTVAFTLSRSVNTVFDIFVTVSNVPQDPFTAYTVAGNTLTFDSAPPSGTNNIDVVYRATNVQTFVPTPGVSTQLGLGSASAPSLTFIGDTNTGIYSPGADTIAFTEGGVESGRFDSSGRLLLGTTTATNNLRLNEKFSIVTAGNNTYTGAAFVGYSGTAEANSCPLLELQRSRGTTDGSFTAVATSDRLGVVTFRGADGAAWQDAAYVIGACDGTPTSNTSVPGRLIFATAASGSPTPTERARFNSTGAFVFNGGTTTADGIGITFPATQSASSNANTLDDYEEGDWTPTLGGNATYTAVRYGRYTKIGNVVTCQFSLQVNAIGTGSTTTVQGFPFAAANIGDVQSGGCSYFEALAISTSWLSCYIQNNATTALFVGQNAFDGTCTNAQGVFGNGTLIYGTITYRVA